MNATEQTFSNILQTRGSFEHYHVPKYQREYIWSSSEWDQLLNDIEENNDGYFIGSIICIDDNIELGPGVSRIFEVVDGQQRLTTLSIILMAIYYKILKLKEALVEPNEEVLDKYKWQLNDIKGQLVYKKNSVSNSEVGYFKDKSDREQYFFLRVQPSTQNNNLDDYLHILSELAIIRGDYRVNYCGVRRLYRAYDYFGNNLPDDYDELIAFLHKIQSLKFIHISVSSSSDAFVLFETLNNRGIPLSPMDIIKNKLLSHLEKQKHMDIDTAYQEWQILLKYLPEYSDQERFLRQFYNAFKVYPNIKIDKYARATRSSLIKIYETYIKRNAKDTIENLLEKAKTYNYFVEPNSNELPESRKEYLLDLQRIGSASSYLFLLYLWSLPKNSIDNWDDVIDEVLQFFIKYYVRRNITDIPNTRDLDAINMDVIEKCERQIAEGNTLSSRFIIDNFIDRKDKPSSVKFFKEKLEDNLFYNNAGMARFVLAKLDETFHSREYRPDLWARNEKGLLVWTVEHIFPQADNITQDWVNMIGNGDRNLAEEIRQRRVHYLGNLTLSGYNSQLSTASFEKKQSLHKDKTFLGHMISIGYKNGLALNKFPFVVKGEETCLADISEWNEESILSRNNALVEFLLKLFAFDKEELSDLEVELN